MKSREEIMNICRDPPSAHSLGNWEEDTAINTKLIVEVLLDIREYLEDIRNK